MLISKWKKQEFFVYCKKRSLNALVRSSFLSTDGVNAAYSKLRSGDMSVYYYFSVLSLTSST